MLDNNTKRKLYELLATPTNFLQNDEGFAVINKVWNLREMPSQDSRYKDAYGDFRQHIINNDDWEVDTIFINRLNLLSGPDNVFIDFIETFVDPEIRKDIRFIEDNVKRINECLIDSGFKLLVLSYFEDLPIHRLMTTSIGDELPIYIPKNEIIFYKSNVVNVNYPCFKLSYANWDDFSYKTTVELTYWPKPGSSIVIGYPKIMASHMSKKIWGLLPDLFTELSQEFCSFCGNEEYYFKLKELFPRTYYSILHALRDAGIYPRISERFEHNPVFRQSLIRENYVEKLWREIRFILAEIDIKNAFKFRYDFKPPYAENGIDLDFNFVYGDEFEIEHRIYVLIGKNGTGKTRILSGIASEIAQEKSKNIGPFKPLYSKIFTLSYSIFDKFEMQEGNNAFNYVYCGLKKTRNEHLTEAELRLRFLKSAELIKDRSLIKEWYDVLKNFISEDVLSSMFTAEDDFSYVPQNFNNTFELLSSGQHILMYVLTELLAQIRNDSLILYDEPETHLHPNAISQLMNSILALVKRFNSFCIIATHSPLVVQCIQSRNVYVINRVENEVELRFMDTESFGENLTVITEDIFGNREIDKDYLKLLSDLVEKKHSYRQIIEMLEKENELPVNLNIRLHLKNMFK